MANRRAGCMGKPLVRFCEGPGNNEWYWVKGTRHVVVACDEASKESLISASDSNDHWETPVYSKILEYWNNGATWQWLPVERESRLAGEALLSKV